MTDEPTNILARLARWPSSAKIFLKPDGSALSAGDRLVQSDLAETLGNHRARRPARVLPRADRLEKSPPPCRLRAA